MTLRGESTRCWPALIFLLFWSVSAAAIDSYRYRKTFEGWPSTNITRGVVVTRGAAYRVELEKTDEPAIFDFIVSTDGEQEIAVNSEQKTFFPLDDKGEGPVATSSLFRLLRRHEGRPSEVSVQVEQTAGDSIEGHPTRKTTVLLAYRLDFVVGRHSFPGHVKATATFWMTDAISLAVPPRMRPRLKTSFEEVDAKLSEALEGISGFPLKQELIVTGTVEGEPSTTERFETVIDSFAASDCSATCFQVPKGYVHRVPVFSQPGVESRVVPEVPNR